MRRLIMPFAGTFRAALARLRPRIAACDRYDLAVAVLLIVLLALALATFDSYAISNDEAVQQRYGELIISYYASGFSDRRLFNYGNLYLYGGLFDVVAVLVERLLPIFDPYTIRHLLCALTGIAGIGAAWATARLVAGSRAGAIAAFALATCGPWYGSMFNHTKDIPFAAAMMGAVYFLCRAARDLPQPKRRDTICFGLLLGAALGIRVLGLLLIGYVGVVILMRMRAGSVRDRLGFVVRSAIALTPAFLIGYLIMIAAWPWSALAPLNPLRGLIELGEFNYQIRTLLDGQIYEMGNVPRWYVPTYLLIKLPLFMLVGVAVALLFILRPGDATPQTPDRRSETALLAFIAAFPVISIVVERGPAFTGLRHFLFVVPVFAVLAGIGFDALLAQCETRRRWLANAAAATMVAALLWNAGMLVRLHPYQYLFFNRLVGGLEGASRLYDTDYWVNIMPEAVDKLEAYVDKLDRTEPRTHRYTVAVCGERLPFEKQANSRLQWTEDWKKAEFFIAPTHMNCDRVLVGEEIATITRLGVRIGVVKDRRFLVQQEMAHQP
ncbi:MAG TPA: glycosyltransferase family 39 protein [Pseudolabrys sp.]|nr:glycosyltransferase family 39 protein [Pseudolabrys sp.]